MYIASVEKTRNPLVEYMSENIQQVLLPISLDNVCEIRIRCKKPIVLHYNDGVAYVSKFGKADGNENNAYIVSQRDIDRCVELLCDGAVYMKQEQMKCGYITIKGGHRVGMCGKAIVEGRRVEHIKEICGLNFRVAREVKGFADCIIDKIDSERGIRNTLVVSSPSCGKTTLLRDIARQLSVRGHKVFIADERSEIAAMNECVCGYDVGNFCDVLDMCPKAEAMMMAIRTMSPEVIITDEIGSSDDFDAVCEAVRCGVGVVASIHAHCAEDLFKNRKYKNRLDVFDLFVSIDKKRHIYTDTYENMAREVNM